MNNDPQGPETEGGVRFGPADHLRLLQLMTQRAVAERRARRAGERRVGGEGPEAAGAIVSVPSGWNLIPDGITLYDWQLDCLKIWMKQGRGTVKVATGGGKTLFALAVAQRLQNEREPDLRVAVIVPTIPLMFQWHEEILRGNLPESAIGLLGGGQELAPLDDLRVLICVLNSARARLPGLVRKAGWANRMLLIVDECHRANASQARKVFDTKPAFTLGLSATPEQELQQEVAATGNAYESTAVGVALGPIIYDFTLKQSLDAGLLTPFEVWHIGLPLAPAEATQHARLSLEIADLRKSLQVRHRKSGSKQGFLAWCQTQASRGGKATAEAERFIGLANRRKRLLYQAQARPRAVLALLSESARDPESRAIVFHESISEIEMIYDRALGLGLPVVLEHSQLPGSLRDESIDAFRRGVARGIISAKSLVEGFNVPSADLGIIAASSGSVRQRIQSLGRMLRRKSADRTARIVVLYVRDTEDETIYAKADWESVIGAKRNNYFVWNPPDDDAGWAAGLKTAEKAPRTYRAPSTEIDTTGLNTGDLYPGQAGGVELRVDSSGNLRLDDGTLVPAVRDLVEAITVHNPHRRARCTPAGHLIVRVDDGTASDPDWRYLGELKLPVEPPTEQAVRLKLKSASGRRVIALEGGRSQGRVRFALGSGRSNRPNAGEACDRLLLWVAEVESQRGVKLHEIFWDGIGHYWLEANGERIPHVVPLAPLEFGG